MSPWSLTCERHSVRTSFRSNLQHLELLPRFVAASQNDHVCWTECGERAAVLTVVGDVSVSFLEDEVDSVPSSPDLLHGLAVSHPRRALPVDLHQLVGHLRAQGASLTAAACRGH